jgi:RecB family exonuclease
MPLIDNFIFSANNLQDYLDCPRRFELKYILKQNWPAVTSQPVLEMENKIQLGNRFHQLAHQYLSGISAKVLEDSIDDPDLGLWFKSFQKYINSFLNFSYFSEFTVLKPFEGFRLIAVFDFISLINTNKIMIGDWKTTSHLPKKEVYFQSIQSYLYPFIAYETRINIFSQSSTLLHQDLSMEYWFPVFPDNTITREHSIASHASSKELLSNLIFEISQKEAGTFEKTANDKRCAFCQYRSLCERGIQAGRDDDAENGFESDLQIDTLDFDQIEEIPF